MENSLKTQMGANKAYFDLKDKNRTSVYERQASIQIFAVLSLITMRSLMLTFILELCDSESWCHERA
jgi:hypothetical protein